VLKPDDFMARFAHVGDDVQVFEHALILRPETISVGDHSRIDDYCRLEGGEGLEIGRHVHVSSFSSIIGGGRCLLGDMSDVAHGARVITGSDQPDAAMSTMAPLEWRHVETSTIVIDHLAFLATNAVMLPGTSLGVGAVAAAGSVVTKPVPAWEIWSGVPARPMGRRDRDALIARGVPVAELETRPLVR
jgi:acetyltransferase-like isoleucine patch superfamily enzyme